jgi:hypothetical protein
MRGYRRRDVLELLGLLAVAPGIRSEAAAATVGENRVRPAIDCSALRSPILLRGDEQVAYRDPAVLLHDGVFHMYYTYIRHDRDGTPYWSLGESRSRDLVTWTEPLALTARNKSQNFCAPGNVIRFGDEWVLCLQTYPTPRDEKYGNEDARVWIMRSRNLESWSEPELLRVRGPDVAVEDMGRMIDPFLVEDKDEAGKWWCLFDTDAANMSWSYDLKTWTYVGRVEAGENVCVLVDGDEYLMFHSPRNGIGMKRSPDMKTWRDVGTLITLGQEDWPWARGRLSAGFVMDLRAEPGIERYLMFFHGTGPEDERVIFHTHACLGLAWSHDLVEWDWPGKGA